MTQTCTQHVYVDLLHKKKPVFLNLFSLDNGRMTSQFRAQIASQFPYLKNGVSLARIYYSIQYLGGLTFNVYRITPQPLNRNGQVVSCDEPHLDTSQDPKISHKKRLKKIKQHIQNCENTYYYDPTQNRALFPRGYLEVLITNREGLAIDNIRSRGYYKFGGLESYDEDHHHSQLPFEAPVWDTKTTSILDIEKINGVGLYLRGFHLDVRGTNTPFLLASTKTSHAIIRLDPKYRDVHLLHNNSCLRKAIQAFTDVYHSLDVKQRELLWEQFWSKDNPHTLCGEFLENTDVGASPHAPYQLYLFGALPVQRDFSACTLQQHHTLDILQMLDRIGFRVPHYRLCDVEGSHQVLDPGHIRSQFMKEGVVRHCLDKDGNSLQMFKIKTHWYKILHGFKMVLDSKHHTPKKLERFLRRFPRVLSLTEAQGAKWKNWMRLFYTWIQNRLQNKPTFAADSCKPIHTSLGLWWQNFVEDLGLVMSG